MKKIYIVMEDSYWSGDEAHDLHDAYVNKDDAVKRLKEEKEKFLESVNISDPWADEYSTRDSDTHYKIEDNFSGDYFELCVVEQELH